MIRRKIKITSVDTRPSTTLSISLPKRTNSLSMASSSCSWGGGAGLAKVDGLLDNGRVLGHLGGGQDQAGVGRRVARLEPDDNERSKEDTRPNRVMLLSFKKPDI